MNANLIYDPIDFVMYVMTSRLCNLYMNEFTANPTSIKRDL